MTGTDKMVVIGDAAPDRQWMESIIQAYPRLSIDWIEQRQVFEQWLSQSRQSCFDLPHLILLESSLAKLTNKTLLKVIRQESSLKMIPLIIFTKQASALDVLSYYQLGCNSYVTKSSDPDHYKRRLIALLNFWLGHVQLALPE